MRRSHREAGGAAPVGRERRRRSFDAAAAAAGATEATPYTLRHSFCSLLIAEGRSVIEVARQMGHGANLTLNTYGHVIDELAGGDRVDAEVEIERARTVLRGDRRPERPIEAGST